MGAMLELDSWGTLDAFRRACFKRRRAWSFWESLVWERRSRVGRGVMRGLVEEGVAVLFPVSWVTVSVLSPVGVWACIRRSCCF